MDSSKLAEQLEQVNERIPQEIQRTADQIMSGLSENNLKLVLDIVISKCGSKSVISIDEIITDLRLSPHSIPQDLKNFLRLKLAEMFEEDALQEVIDSFASINNEQTEEVARFNDFLKQKETELEQIMISKAGKINLKDRKVKLEQLLNGSQAKMLVVNDNIKTIKQLNGGYNTTNQKNLDSLNQLFMDIKHQSQTELIPMSAVSNAEEAEKFLSGLNRIRNCLLVIFGINYGILEKVEDQKHIARMLEQFYRYRDQHIDPLLSILNESIDLMSQNLVKLSKSRIGQILDIEAQLSKFQIQLDQQIQFCKERLQKIITNEQKIDTIVKAAQTLKNKQKLLKKAKYELRMLQQSVEQIDESDGEELRDEQQQMLNEKVSYAALLTDEIKKIDAQFVKNGQSFEGLSACELMEILLTSKLLKGTEEAVDVFKTITEE